MAARKTSAPLGQVAPPDGVGDRLGELPGLADEPPQRDGPLDRDGERDHRARRDDPEGGALLEGLLQVRIQRGSPDSRGV
jgi:hypothetical protein